MPTPGYDNIDPRLRFLFCPCRRKVLELLFVGMGKALVTESIIFPLYILDLKMMSVMKSMFMVT